METVAYMASFIAFIWCVSLSAKVSRLEKKLKDAGIGVQEKKSLKEIMEKNIGKFAKIKFEEHVSDIDLFDKYCLIEDVDEEWVLLKIGKKDMEKLIRIDSIKNVQFKM